MEPDGNVYTVVTSATRRRLLRTKRWMRSVGTTAVIGGLGYLALVLILGVPALGGPTWPVLVLSGGLLLSAVYYIVPAVFLFRVAGAVERFALLGEDGGFETLVDHQYRLWRIVGALVVVALLVLALVAVRPLVGILQVVYGS